MAEITFFDLASRPKNSCWSLNPWKTRLQLNYKGVKYNTEWLEYPDLAPRLKSLGLDPNAAGVSAASYTSPAVLFHDDSKAFMDSKSIATEIEKRYPSPVLPVKTPMQERLEKVFLDVQDTLRPELVPRVPKNLLNPRSKEYFERTRAERLQMSLDEFERRGGGQQAWEKASEGLKKIAGLLQENEGPFFDGEQVSFADFIFVGYLRFVEILNGPLFDWMTQRHSAFARLYDASKQWLARDDY